VVARINRVDGDEGDVAQVLAALQRRRLGRLSFGLGVRRKAHRDAVGMDGDQRGRARLVFAADHFQQLAALGPVAGLGGSDLGQHQVAVAQLLRRGIGEDEGVLRAAVDRLDADLAARLADHAQHPLGAGAQLLDDPGLGRAVLELGEADQQAVTHAGRRADIALAGRGQRDQRGVVALDQLHEEFAVRVAFDDVDDADFGQGAGFGEAAAAAPAECPVGFERLQHLAEGPALLALQGEGLGDGGLVGLAAVTDVFEEGFFVGNAPGGARAGL
jgi:hypothetical protein